MNKLIEVVKKIKPLGFTGLSLYDVSVFFIKGLQEGAITTRASSLAFNFFLAFFPSIIVFFTLIPYIPIDGFQQTLMEIISNVLPPSTNSATITLCQTYLPKSSEKTLKHSAPKSAAFCHLLACGS